MKRPWVWILLGLSLGLNVGVLGTAWFQRTREPAPATEQLFFDELPAPVEPVVVEPASSLPDPTEIDSEVPAPSPPTTSEPDRVDPAPSPPPPRTEPVPEPETPTESDPRQEIQPPADQSREPRSSPDGSRQPPSPRDRRDRAALPSAERLMQRLDLDADQASEFLRIQKSFFRETRVRLARIESLQRELRRELVGRRPDQEKIDRLLGQLGRAHAELEAAFTESVLLSRGVLDERQERLYLHFLSQVRARAFGMGNRETPQQQRRRRR